MRPTMSAQSGIIGSPLLIAPQLKTRALKSEAEQRAVYVKKQPHLGPKVFLNDKSLLKVLT